ncbi:MAG: PIN domain nuclease [Acidimicrobiia bacterium]|nr:PIN domain nuclease [Acidimicrobiia bacterium]
MILVDTSAWIEFLRDTGSDVCVAVDRLLDADLGICDAVSMEVLAGARNERHLIQLRGLLARATMLPTTPADYDAAASMYRSCRARGETVRKLIDCLIGAVAVRAGAEILHADVDFSALARHTDVQLHPDSRS